MEYEVYTDGSCKGNPGPGGIGAVVYKDGSIEHTFRRGIIRRRTIAWSCGLLLRC